MEGVNEKIVIRDKILIKAELELLTGMHIGTSDGIATIGAVDSIVIRDPMTNRTMIPGSSLKGKMRRLLLNAQGQKDVESCPSLERLFGSSQKAECKDRKTARLQFTDSILTDESEKELSAKQLDLSYTEIKYENTIDPITLVANPRQIERAVRGSKYDVVINYTLQNLEEVIEDFENIAKGFKLLQLDYIGGNGSRGYGRIKFNKIDVLPMQIKGENLIKDQETTIKQIMDKVME